MIATTPTITLNNGVELPALGLGVLYADADETAPAVTAALNTGYRLVDTAAFYQNEAQVGEGLKAAAVDRDDVFVTTKLWLSDWGYDAALRAFDASAAKLGLEVVDLYLLHFPNPSDWANTIASYRAAERLLGDGRVRAIGVSNFKPQRLDALLAEVDTVPAVNQVELHPYFAQRELRAKHAEFGIVTQAWSPIAGIRRYYADSAEGQRLLDNPQLAEIAQRHDKTTAQVVLRWHLQHGISAIPKSVRPERIEENFDVFDFELNADDMTAIDALDTGERSGPDPDIVDARFFDAA
jgi:diketogulonate reductase-like aldo/keto reductase